MAVIEFPLAGAGLPTFLLPFFLHPAERHFTRYPDLVIVGSSSESYRDIAESRWRKIADPLSMEQ